MVRNIEDYVNRMKMVQKERAKRSLGMEKIDGTEMFT